MFSIQLFCQTCVTGSSPTRPMAPGSQAMSEVQSPRFETGTSKRFAVRTRPIRYSLGRTCSGYLLKRGEFAQVPANLLNALTCRDLARTIPRNGQISRANFARHFDHAQPLAHGGNCSGRPRPKFCSLRHQGLWQPCVESSLWKAVVKHLVDDARLETQTGDRRGVSKCDQLHTVQATQSTCGMVSRTWSYHLRRAVSVSARSCAFGEP
jgi:hypothetical protein